MVNFTSARFISLLLLLLVVLSGCGSGGSKPLPVAEVVNYVNLSLEIKGNGSGRIYIEELNRYCSSICTFQVEQHSTITLYAEPTNSENLFIGWNDNCSETSPQCTLSATANLSISADFQASSNFSSLSTIVEGTGKVEIINLDETCSDYCQYSIANDKTIRLIATPTDNTEFLGWDNDCEKSLECDIKITGDTLVKATFSSIQKVPLTLNIIGNGTIEVSESGEVCNNSCIYFFSQNETISLKVEEGSSTDFLNWSENCVSSTESCSIVTSAATVVNAYFSQNNSNTSNTITIQEPLGETYTNIPIQIARPFIKGEITSTPVLSINGKNISSQATIKQRYEDGSIKHAVMHFVIDELPANGQLKAAIINGSAPSGLPLTKTEMLSSSFNFDAIIEYSFESGGIERVSARKMLENNDYVIWAEGPTATTLILSDHSTERKYDVGNDQHRSIRPVFHVTFWKELNEYSVRYISENTNTLSLQDQSYDLKLFLGSSKILIYGKNNIFHQARTIWTKRFSSFVEPRINLNHNINYLVRTNSIPYFDTNRKISENAISTIWNNWKASSTDLYDRGFWQTAMPTAGGRPDIGLYPSWAVQWVFSGDWRLTDIAVTQTELAGAWPMFMREGKSNLKFDFEGKHNAQGKIVSIAPEARPTHWIDRPNWHEILESDKIHPITALTSTVWKPDNAHHPDIGSLQYLLTGELFFLEAMLNSAAYITSNNNAKAFGYRYGRGETGSEGLLYSGGVRGQAWALRTRVHTYDILPDIWPEKAYFDQLNKNAIAAFEGLFNLEQSYPELSSIYEHSKNIVSPRAFVKTGSSSTLGFWDEGTSSASYVSDTIVDTNVVKQAIAPWMQNFVTISLGRAKELGYKTDNLLAYSSNYLNQLLNTPNLPKEVFSAYITPTLNQNDSWFGSVDDIVSSYTDNYITTIGDKLSEGKDSEHGYYGIGMAAAAYSYSPNYAQGWLYIKENVISKDIYNNNPKWAILPRPVENEEN